MLNEIKLILKVCYYPYIKGTAALEVHMSATITKPTTIRIEEGLKAQAVAVLDSIGLSYNAYVTLATKQLVNQRRIPFDLAAMPKIPNEATRKALVAAEAKELGLIPDDAQAFDTADSLMAFLDGE